MKKVIKPIIISIIVIIILILLLAGTLVYMYVDTDIFKNDQQLFYKYISQNADIFEIFKDEELIEYSNAKQNTPYENTGKYYVTGLDYVPEQIQDFNVTFNGQKDKTNKYAYQQININYSDNTSTTVDYVNEQDCYGLKIEGVLKKYLAIENNNLKELCQKLGVEDISDIPDKIDFDVIESESKFTEEEIQEIKNIIKSTLDENITKESFTSNTTTETKIYQLNITSSQAKYIIYKIIDNISNNELIMNRMKEIYKSQNNANDQEASEYITELKEKISDYFDNEEDEEINYSFKVYVQDEQLIKTELNIDSTTSEYDTINIVLNRGTNNVSLEIQTYENSEFTTQVSCNMEKTKENDRIGYKLSLESQDYGNIELSMKWNGIQTLEKVNEQYILAINDGTQNLQYIFTNQNTFEQSINKKVEDKEIEVINEYDQEKLEKTLEKLSTAIEKLNEEKMNEIGLQESDNPILYYIPIVGQLINKF